MKSTMNNEIIKCIVNKECIQLLNGDILSRNQMFYFYKDKNCNNCMFYDLYNNDNSYIKYTKNGYEKTCQFSLIKYNNYYQWGWISIKDLCDMATNKIQYTVDFQEKENNQNLDYILIKSIHEISKIKNNKITIKEILCAMNKYIDNLPTPKKIGTMIRKLNICAGKKSHGIYKYQINNNLLKI